jgi:hypothetical protein
MLHLTLPVYHNSTQRYMQAKGQRIVSIKLYLQKHLVGQV